MDAGMDKFKMILLGVFGLSIFAGLIAFSTYKAGNTTNTTVSVSVWGTIDKNIFDNYVEKYKQVAGQIFTVKYTYIDPNVIDAQLVEALATGKGPDAILIPHTLVKRYLDKVYPITTIPERTFKDTFVQEAGLYLQPSGIFGLPLFVDPMVMYWNKDMFSSAGIVYPPKTWAEFPLIVSKLSKIDNNSNISKSAVALGEYNNINNAKELISTLLLQAGTPIVSYDGARYVSTLDYKSSSDILEPAVSALQFYTEYSNPKKIVYSWNRALKSSKNSFLSEDLAVYFGFASEYNEIKEKNPNLNFDVAVMPQVVNSQSKATFGELYGFALMRASSNLVPTFNVLTQLVGANAVTPLLDSLNVGPARLDIVAQGNKDPAKAVFYASSLISKGWLDPSSYNTDAIFSEMINNITSGKMSVQDSVSKASLQLNTIL